MTATYRLSAVTFILMLLFFGVALFHPVAHTQVDNIWPVHFHACGVRTYCVNQ